MGGNIRSDIHAMDEREEMSARQEQADFFSGIAYLSPILIGWGIVVVLMGLYSLIGPSANKWTPMVTMCFGAVLIAVGTFAHFYFKGKANQLTQPEPGIWVLK